MLSHTPYYIILGEFGIAIVLAVLANRQRQAIGERPLQLSPLLQRFQPALVGKG